MPSLSKWPTRKSTSLHVLIQKIMASPMFHEITKQASFFFKEKLRTARLAITDVTFEELLTEEVTSSGHLPPDARSMAIITRASSEVDQFERIVKILHNRILKFDRSNWRAFYNALVLLDHLLVHGPLSVAKEFQYDKEVIEETQNFQCVDEKGVNWGLKVKSLSERVSRLLEDDSLLKEERERKRRQPGGRIVGFGGLSFRRSSSPSESSERDYGRSNSLFNDRPLVLEQDGYVPEDDHPFFQNEHEAAESLLPSLT